MGYTVKNATSVTTIFLFHKMQLTQDARSERQDKRLLISEALVPFSFHHQPRSVEPNPRLIPLLDLVLPKTTLRQDLAGWQHLSRELASTATQNVPSLTDIMPRLLFVSGSLYFSDVSVPQRCITPASAAVHVFAICVRQRVRKREAHKWTTRTTNCSFLLCYFAWLVM